MDTLVKYSTLISRLEENNLPYEKLVTPHGIEFILLERGGHILGPFWDKYQPGLFWATPLLNEPHQFKHFLENAEWNIGGDRVWIAPEVQYNITDRYDFDGSYCLPKQMDPGTYHLTKDAVNTFQYTNTLTLEAHIISSGNKNLSLTCMVTLCEDPLRNIPEYQNLANQVKFGGYERTLLLEEQEHDKIMSEAWNLVQLNAGGKMIIPTSQPITPCFYRGNFNPSSFQITSHAVITSMDGQNKYKFGLKAPFVLGRIGYYHQIDDNFTYLLIKNFYNNPSSIYCEEPPLQPGEHGFSIHVYNDDGGLGGFCEMEINGQTIGGKTQKTKSLDSVLLWAYIGKADSIKKISEWLLGVTP